MNTTGWLLTDYFEPNDDIPEGWTTYHIHSQDDLRNALRELSRMEPRIAELETPYNEVLRIGIGGQYAGFSRVQLPSMTTHLLLASEKLTDKSVVFETQAQPSTLQGEELHDPETIITLICHYYLHGEFPSNLVWRKT